MLFAGDLDPLAFLLDLDFEGLNRSIHSEAPLESQYSAWAISEYGPCTQ